MTDLRFMVEHIRLTIERPFDDFVRAFERQLGRFDPAAYQAEVERGDAEGARAKIESMAGISGLMIFGTLNHGAALLLAGQKRKALQYAVGNPLIALQMTRHEIGAALYAPLRVLIYESDGGSTSIEYDQPSSLLSPFGNADVSAVAVELDKKLENLISGASGDRRIL